MTSSATNIHGLAVFLIKSTANRFITVARSGNTGKLSQESSKRYLQGVYKRNSKIGILKELHKHFDGNQFSFSRANEIVLEMGK